MSKAKPAVNDLDEREVQRLAFINVCRNLAEPLRAFLNHPWVANDAHAKTISDAINEILNEDPVAGNYSQGDSAAMQLLEMAQGHEAVYEPDWLKPLAYYLGQALEDDATPGEFHNDLLDAVDHLLQPYTDEMQEPAATARQRLADGIARAIAGRQRKEDTGKKQ